jgi:hypothetical protein
MQHQGFTVGCLPSSSSPSSSSSSPWLPPIIQFLYPTVIQAFVSPTIVATIYKIPWVEICFSTLSLEAINVYHHVPYENSPAIWVNWSKPAKYHWFFALISPILPSFHCAVVIMFTLAYYDLTISSMHFSSIFPKCAQIYPQHTTSPQYLIRQKMPFTSGNFTISIIQTHNEPTAGHSVAAPAPAVEAPKSPLGRRRRSGAPTRERLLVIIEICGPSDMGLA